MGLELPGMPPGELTRRLMEASPCSILLLNQGCDPCYSRVFEALGQGAADAAILPPATDWEHAGAWDDLLNRFNTLSTLIGHDRGVGELNRSGPDADPLMPPPVIAIGSSTGGPKALAAVLSGLPANLPAAVVIVQHLDVHFTEGLAEWLDQATPLRVSALTKEARLQAGQVWVAARPEHLIVMPNLNLGWTPEWPDLICRPSIDVFFKSLARYPVLKGCGVLLTGMGRDGAAGLLALRQAGFRTVAQDEATSVVYGMPKAAAELNAAEVVLPLEMIATHLLGLLNNSLKTHPSP
jgi:two-component system response regulator WspF